MKNAAGFPWQRRKVRAKHVPNVSISRFRVRKLLQWTWLKTCRRPFIRLTAGINPHVCICSKTVARKNLAIIYIFATKLGGYFLQVTFHVSKVRESGFFFFSCCFSLHFSCEAESTCAGCVFKPERTETQASTLQNSLAQLKSLIAFCGASKWMPLVNHSECCSRKSGDTYIILLHTMFTATFLENCSGFFFVCLFLLFSLVSKARGHWPNRFINVLWSISPKKLQP